MRTIALTILAITLASCMSVDRMPTPDDRDRETIWHQASARDQALTERLLVFMMQNGSEQVTSPIVPLCSDDGGTCCSYSAGGDWCCCSFTLGCRCQIKAP